MDQKKLQALKAETAAKIERVHQQQAAVVKQQQKAAEEREALDGALARIDPDNDGELERHAKRRAELAARTELLDQRAQMAAATVRRIEQEAATTMGQARAEVLAELRGELKRADADARKAVEAAASTVASTVARARATAAQMAELEAELNRALGDYSSGGLPESLWAYLPACDPAQLLTAAGQALGRAQWHDSMRSAA